MAKATKASKLAQVGEEAKLDAQRDLMLDAIRRSGGDMEKIAATLGVTRTNLYEAAERLGVDLAAERERAERVR